MHNFIKYFPHSVVVLSGDSPRPWNPTLLSTDRYSIADIDSKALQAQLLPYVSALSVFFTPNGTIGGTKAVDLKSVNSLFIDVDFKINDEAELNAKKEEAIDAFINHFPLHPTFIVKTASGIHVYWLLDKPFYVNENTREKTAVRFIDIEQQLIKLCSSHFDFPFDDKVKNVTRLLRVPGYYWLKDNAGESPFAGRPVEVVLAYNHPENRITAERIRELFPEKSKRENIKRIDYSIDGEYIKDGIIPICINNALSSNIGEGSRNATAIAVASMLKSIGFSEQSTYIELMNSIAFSGLPEHEIRSVVKSAFYKGYKYNCQSREMKQFCIGKQCPFRLEYISRLNHRT